MDKVAILDCGGQYTKVIDRRVRELGLYTQIFSGTISPAEIDKFSAIILSGGPASVYDENSIKINKDIFKLGKPILAICYGMQFLAHAFGGTVKKGEKGEYGVEELEILDNTNLFKGIKNHTLVLMSHFDVVENPGSEFKVIARTANIGAIKHVVLPIFGVQFHPEVELTEDGQNILKNFLFEISKLSPEYTLDTRIAESIKKIKKSVNGSRVLVLVSGGVDSAVTLALLHKTISDQNIIAIHIDNGFMRKNESEKIKKAFIEIGYKDLIVIDAKDYFLNSPVVDNGREYKNVFYILDPELRRRVIGKRFVEVAEEKIKSLNLDFEKVFIAQGTLRPDLIESGNPDISKFAHTIKTHHNDVKIIRDLRVLGRVIETNSEWHKDEVRQVAKLLGLPDSIAYRQPFPGPGLSIRIINSEVEKKVEKIDGMDNGIEIYGTVLQAVGVQGDERSYKNVSIIQPKQGLNFVDWELLIKAAKRFTNRNSMYNRVIVPLTHVEKINELMVRKKIHDAKSVDLLRQIDDCFIQSIKNTKISQGLVVLVPLGIKKEFSAVIRLIMTNDFMTGNPAVPPKDFPELKEVAVDVLKKFENDIECVFYDVSSKPPATVEWL
jgi:GMP synthase (glutamine-hydrolysing)